MFLIKKDYDFLIVGAGLFGAVFACEARKRGKRCLVVDRREHIGGNVYTENVQGIQVHRYGPHIFHTHMPHIWEYVKQFADFNHFVYSPLANYNDEIYNLPFNMNTFRQIWGVTTPKEAANKLYEQQGRQSGEAENLEEQALSLVGHDIYEKLIKDYTEKQWGMPCAELPAFIIRRLPVRLTYDNNYFSDPFQGIPIGGYTAMVERMLAGCEVRLRVDFAKEQDSLRKLSDNILYTGAVDAYFNFCYGALAYRSLRFETEILPVENEQGVAVVNYTAANVPFTRRIEHKHFEFGTQAHTVITKEYPAAWSPGEEAYYPINDTRNQALYDKYKALADVEPGVLFGGRLGTYRYLDMDDVIDAALQLAGKVSQRTGVIPQ